MRGRSCAQFLLFRAVTVAPAAAEREKSETESAITFSSSRMLGSPSDRATLPLDPVLRLPFLSRLPLHVRRRISATARERHAVVNDVPRPPARMPGLAHEALLRRFAALEPAVAVPPAGSRMLCRARVAHRRRTRRRGPRCRDARAPRRRVGPGRARLAPSLTGCVPCVGLDRLPGARRVAGDVHAAGA